MFIRKFRLRLLVVAATAVVSAAGYARQETGPPCSATGAPPMETVPPVTQKPKCKDGRLLKYSQEGVERYACLNLPPQAKVRRPVAGRKWPLVIYLHASLTDPGSLYKEGKSLFELHRTYALSDDPAVTGFIILAPEGRRAKAWQSPGSGAKQTGIRWDEWYRDPARNLDAAAIDHFLDEAIAAGLVDTNRIYVFGWSNGSFMAALYGVWRGDRIAAIGQYAGANPWARPPCPIQLPAGPQVPLLLMRNLCDAVVPCSTTNEWIGDLAAARWPFQSYNLFDSGAEAPASQPCATQCSTVQGVHDHIRWPHKSVLENRLLPFFKQHTLPR
ncbi:MAG TPA: PHB depolymerase family esterase [Thermoanaerobaculia bacterium]|nr:PHB depolymerase family esterase [Thermoanaerobaculia bacterium]